MSPSITTFAGASAPKPKSCCRATKPSLARRPSGKVLTPDMPMLIENSGVAIATSRPPASARLNQGRRMTAYEMRSQTPPVLPTGPERPPMNGTRNRFTPSPIRLRTAGSSVSEAATAATTTRIAPIPTLKKSVNGTISMPSSAITTVSPLTSTARLAVAPAAAIASTFSRPRARSSRKRETTISE